MASELDRLSDSQLLERYATMALHHGKASRDGDHKRANMAYEDLASIVRIVRARDAGAAEALGQLLRDERLDVRVWAATHMLEFDSPAAESTLREIAQGPASLNQLDAKMVLREWESGRLRFP
jgi:hypothetical protein